MFVCCVNINVILQTAPSPIMDTSSINNLLFSASFQVFMTSSSLLIFNAIIIPSRTLLSLSLWQRFVSISKQTIESIFLTRFFFSVRLLQLRAHSWPIYNWFLFFLLGTASSTTEIFSTFNAHSCFQRKKKHHHHRWPKLARAAAATWRWIDNGTITEKLLKNNHIRQALAKEKQKENRGSRR